MLYSPEEAAGSMNERNMTYCSEHLCEHSECFEEPWSPCSPSSLTLPQDKSVYGLMAC
jgi:hypothetical protein